MKENILVKEFDLQEERAEKQDGRFSKALHKGAQVTGLGHEALRFKNQVSQALNEALEDGRREAKRAFKRGYNAAEDLVDDTAHRVKHHPIQAVAIAFGVGALFGCMITGIGRKLTKA
jgi:ElaB/YqjD/DUF883 family membrane-anchored ribosome-binding protein